MRTLWLADHLLVSQRGHHVSYNGFIADAAKRVGMEMQILCARECKAQVPGGFLMRGVFRRDPRNTPSPLISRSRLALDLLESLARQHFQADLAKGIPLMPSKAKTSSSRRCSLHETWSAGFDGSERCQRKHYRLWCFMLAMHLSASAPTSRFLNRWNRSSKREDLPGCTSSPTARS
jgi:hypothetical protein